MTSEKPAMFSFFQNDMQFRIHRDPHGSLVRDLSQSCSSARKDALNKALNLSCLEYAFSSAPASSKPQTENTSFIDS